MRQSREFIDDQERAMRLRADELARSGRHAHYDSIMLQLRVEFDRDPHFIFEPPYAKERFNRMCEQARANGTEPHA